MLVSDLLNALLTRYPVNTAESWDHVGLSVGHPTDEITGVVCALDVTIANLEEAFRRGANVLLTHHPVYIKAPDSFAPMSPQVPAAASALLRAAELGVSIISLHTNLDRSIEARALLADLSGFTPSSSLEHPDDSAACGLGAFGRTLVPTTLEGLAARCATSFGTTPRVWGDPASSVASIALLGGSLGSFGELAIDLGADVIVTGEAGYHVCQDLALRGLSVILLGHDRSEEPFVELLADSARDAGVDDALLSTIVNPSQWWTYTKGER